MENESNTSGKQKGIFIIIALFFLLIELGLLYLNPNAVYGAIFIVTFLGFLGYYLFQYSGLTSFSVGALSANAKFVKEKAKEVQEDSESIKQLRNETQGYKENTEQILKGLEETKGEIEKYKTDLMSLEAKIIEITYLQNEGRNIFPNPYEKRIMDKINEILEIAVPEPEKRALFVKEITNYTKRVKEKFEKPK